MLVTVLLGEARRLQEGHLSVGVQVFLVAAQDDDDVGAGQRPGVRQPVGQGVVRFPAVEERDRTGQRGQCGASNEATSLAF